ncbi:hypothetical protein GZ212_10470 [Mangrovimonas sp. CR14]|uniref:hypothetical protein n=1 Tax=Mangrovimonas sp. CR14 TaxID=2706120 RepID=UPI001420C916|nr:hypothetical protein [Mangrovimonas sp. CR14]NIK92573.1 hypothetical protein [Mangrovimonas sp. CR14]
MNKENTLLVLWILFGFMFISAIDSFLRLLTFSIYVLKSELGLSYKILTFSMPLVTLTLYSLITFFILRKLKSDVSGIYLTKFPKILFIGSFLVTLLLNPLTNRLSRLYSERLTSIKNANVYDVLEVHEWMSFGIGFSRWIILIILAFIFLNKLNKTINKNETH